MASHRVPSGLLKLMRQPVTKTQIRCLSLHERESQKMLIELGVKVPRTKLVCSFNEVREVIRDLGTPCVVKAEIVGQNPQEVVFESGLQGAYHLVDTANKGVAIASQMLGGRLRRQSTQESRTVVKTLCVTETVESDANWYLAMSVDRESYGPIIVISRNGGLSIDEIAKRNSTSFTFKFGLSSGITTSLISQISTQLELSCVQSSNLKHLLQQIFKIFSQKDATLLEINPLAVSEDGTLTSMSTRFIFDDAARERQPDIFALRDTSLEVAEEVEAERHGLVYVKMQGNIGILVNGAGLAMATNDAICFEGGASANFLDTGGKATTKTMQKAFEIITRDERVRAILVNIYGGLTRCDMIAESIIYAVKQLDIRVPMVVRLQGTNSEQGLRLLEEAKLSLDLVVESDWRAAQRVVELASLS
ncbi:hypothetical protein XA68_10980 [Ophiocordyceps unilateralis]|uniref:ATP-grasp domain-containing protein n=1 Tax=Ophiocordyceps unilateralis TaxID=268505 RepID=A0A2A9PQG8_OPHUN|nr:hypothetical protein XA68_10980 [Ophiocordyceps unilateralis]